MRLPHLAFAATLLALASQVGSAQTLTFDDLTTRRSFFDQGIAGSYAGYHWGTTLFGTQSSLTGWASATVANPAVNPANPPVSGSSYVWNWDGPQSVFVDFLSPTNVAGAYFSTLSPNAPFNNAQFVQMLGYDASGTLVGTTAPLVLTDSYQFLDASFSDVRAIEVRANLPSRWWSMDNLTLNATTTVTPEPATLTLFVTGLAGVFAAARRRRSTWDG